MSFIASISAIAASVASAAGAVSGAIAAPIAAGLGSLGVSAGTAGAIGGAIGTGAVGAAGGAGLGAITSAAMGKDPGEGAGLGALGGFITGGASSALGSLGSAASSGSSAAGAAVGDTAAQMAGTGAIQQAFPAGAQTLGDIANTMGTTTNAAAEAAGGAFPAGAPTLGQMSAEAGLSGGMSGSLGSLGSMASDFMGSGMGKELGMEALKAGYGEMQTQAYNDKVNQINKAHRYGYADGGLATLKGGGSIKMVDGQYVVSADVVSALGNGSSKAGAKFLQEAFNQIRTQGGRRQAKPQKKAGDLAQKRMLERVKKQKKAA